MRSSALLASAFFAIVGCRSSKSAHDHTASHEANTQAVLGTAAPEWTADHWLNSPPLTLADLRGKVVLVRWWTADCPYCATSAPLLRKLSDDFGPKGLVVIGMYHHKDDRPLDYSRYEDVAKQYRFNFPVAIDPDWKTLKRWSAGVDSGFTSLSFIVDKRGVFRHIHPGGSYVESNEEYIAMRQSIEKALAE